MRTFQRRCLFAAVLILGTSLSCAVEPPIQPGPVNQVAAPLDGIELVEATTLTDTGNVLTPRQDSRVPQLMVDLLRDESIVRIYPWCTFEMVDGHPIWTWKTWSNSGIYAESGEALRVRLVERLRKLGFKPLPETLDAIPSIQRSGERPLKYRKTEQVREITVEFGGLISWTGGRRPAVGIDIACIILGIEKIAPPKFSELVAAVPTLAAPTHGKQTIPPAMIDLIQSLPVTSANLSGTGTTWYSLTIVTPQTSLKEFNLHERIEAQLIKAKFKQDDTQNGAQETNVDPLLHYVARSFGETSSCRIRVDKSAGNCRIGLFVQP